MNQAVLHLRLAVGEIENARIMRDDDDGAIRLHGDAVQEFS